MKKLASFFCVFFAGCGAYLWLALLDCPFFRIEDIEPAALIYALCYITINGHTKYLALLSVATVWGVFFSFMYVLILLSLPSEQTSKSTPWMCGTWYKILLSSFVLTIGIVLVYLALPKCNYQRTIWRGKALSIIIQQYQKEHGVYPKTLNGLRLSWDDMGHSLLCTPNGKYVDYQLKDDACTLTYDISDKTSKQELIIHLTPEGK